MRTTTEGPTDESFPNVFLPVYIPTFFVNISHGMLWASLPHYILSLGASPPWVATISTALTLGKILVSPISSIEVADFSMNRNLMKLIFFIYGIAMVLVLVTRSLVTVLLSSLLIGSVVSVFHTLRLAYILFYIPVHGIRRTISQCEFLQHAGLVAGALLGGFLSGSIGTNTPLTMQCVISAVTAIMLTYTEVEHDAHARKNTSKIPPEAPSSIHISEQAIKSTKIFIICMTTTRSVRRTLLPLIGWVATKQWGWIGFCIALSYIGEAIASNFNIFFRERFGFLNALIIPSALTALGYALLTLVPIMYSLLPICALVLGTASGLSGEMLPLAFGIAREQQTRYMDCTSLVASLLCAVVVAFTGERSACLLFSCCGLFTMGWAFACMDEQVVDAACQRNIDGVCFSHVSWVREYDEIA